MVSEVKVLVVIPARGGSKSIPKKNIRHFAGWPLIAWSIAAAKESKLASRIIVSTDDHEIASVARQFGAETPFLRPKKFAQDTIPDLPVFVHALKWLDKHEGCKPDVIVQLRPTSPIRPRGLVDKAIKILLAYPEADSVRGVVPAGQDPHKMWKILDEKSSMKNLLEVDGVSEPYNMQRQKLPPVYWQTGHIDAIRPETIIKGSMSGEKIYPLIIDPLYTVDIDTELDWSIAEWSVGNLKLSIIRP